MIYIGLIINYNFFYLHAIFFLLSNYKTFTSFFSFHSLRLTLHQSDDVLSKRPAFLSFHPFSIYFQLWPFYLWARAFPPSEPLPICIIFEPRVWWSLQIGLFMSLQSRYFCSHFFPYKLLLHSYPQILNEISTLKHHWSV